MRDWLLAFHSTRRRRTPRSRSSSSTAVATRICPRAWRRSSRARRPATSSSSITRSVAERLTPIAQRFPWARFIAEPDNPGFATAVNRGVRASTTPYVIVLNPDCVLERPRAQPARRVSRRDARRRRGRPAAAERRWAACSRRDAAFPDLTTAFGGRRSWLTATAPGNWFSRRNLLLTAGDTAPKQVDWVSGACMMIRREAFEQVGGMDERFFLYWEDADFCRRLAARGLAHACGIPAPR